jgi:superfamily II DNA helicase RecQ
MPLKFFIVPACDPAEAETELNSFLGRHRVVAIDRRWVDQGGSSFWAICVDHFAPGSGDGRRVAGFARTRIDYKQVLSPAEFIAFSRLRDLRKQIAQTEAVPVYAVFTNEQLAQVVQQRCRTAGDLKKIDGIGEARIDKYAEPMLAILGELPEGHDETGGQPV